MRDDRGSTTIWLLGLSVLLLLFGGLALDFWRGLALQRELAAVADSAAIAAASGIDEVHFRESGEVRLDPARAVGLANDSIAFQGVRLSAVEVSVSADGLSVSVAIRGELDLGLLGAFVRTNEPLTVGASAVASPRRIP